jgi:eukaryotic-like serine/threonine-protein kinase
MIGTTLHHYRIVSRLGAGGMGEVYAAEDLKLGRRVALKVLPPEMAADPERLQRFQREARAVAALNHPNIVTIYSVEEADGVQFLTMELVEGKTLSEAIPAGGLPLAEFVKLAVTLVEAVAFAHEHGIVHRDLKPANIMLADGDRLKVLDFGLAKLKPALAGVAADETTFLAPQSLTQVHAVVGTPWYMSPEQAEGRPVDHRSDIFSLGVVLYEMACGRRPFDGDSAVSVISSVIKDTPSPPSAVNLAVPPALDHIVARALAKDPAARYQRAVELRDDLLQVREQTASGRAVVRLVRGVARSRWALRLAAAAGLLAVAAEAAWYLSAARRGEGRRSDSAPLRATFRRLTADPGVEQFPSLLPDGKWVVYAGQQTGNMDIYLLSTSGQNPINLTKDSPADDDEPAASPDGERIAFRSEREGGGIFVMGRTGEGVKRVTPVGLSAAFNPTWSPDGAEIAFTSENVQLAPLNWEGRSSLSVVNVGTGQVRRLDVGDAVQASWSPHGQRIAFVARQFRSSAEGRASTPVMDIRTVPARGGAPVSLTNDPAADWSPVWSPDGRYVYFASERGGSMNLWRIAVDEASGKPLGQPEPITTPAPFLAHPSVSADGHQIAYSAVTKSTNIQRLTLNAAGTGLEGQPSWVTTGSGVWANPDVTPDGEWVAFYSQDQPEGHIYVSRSDGTGRRYLTNDAFVDRVPRWSPDGKWVAFFSTRSGPFSVWRIRLDGSDLQPVVEGSTPVWSPDGSRLAASAAVTGTSEETRIVDVASARARPPEVLPRPPETLRPFIAQSWSPDGTKLAGQIGYAWGGKGIVLYTFASGTYERLTDFGEWPAWFPDSRRVLLTSKGKEYWVLDTRTKQAQKIYSTVWDVIGPPRMTRDGRSIVLSRRVTEADIYLLSFE